MRNNFRIRLLSKLAQQSEPTEQVAKTHVVTAPLPSFVATSEYPTIIVGFGPAISGQINNLSDALNRILHYYSNGKYSMKELKQSGFPPVSDALPDIINLTNFATLIFQNFYNSGNKFIKALTADEMRQRLDMVANSSAFSDLKEAQLSGQLSKNIGGTTSNKSRLKYFLDTIRSLIPT